MVETARTLVTNALLDLGVIAEGETPTASQAVGGLRKLNNMIDAWNIENLMVYGSTQNVFPLVSNDGVYTLGTGGDFNIPRPDNIISAYVRDSSLPAAQIYDFPLYIYNTQEYADVRLKGLTTALPQGVYFDDSFPLINVYVYPVPSTAQYSLVIWTPGILPTLTLDTVISLAPGYKRALESNLVIELAASYERQPPQTVISIAQSSKADLKTKNFQLGELQIDDRLTTPNFNWLTGDSY